jgi:hypothetical protein
MWRDVGKKDPLNPRAGQVVLQIPKGKDRLYINTNLSESEMIPTTYSPEIRINPHL